jgi:hypothetical protein
MSNSIAALRHLQVLDVGPDGLVQADELVLTKVLLQNLLGASSRQNLAQILAVVFEVFRYLRIGTGLAHGGEDRVPVVGFREGKDSFTLDVGIDQSGDV